VDAADYSLNRSFRSDEQVLILNPCDYSRLSDTSAQEATPIEDDGNQILSSAYGLADKPGAKVAQSEHVVGWAETKKSKLFSNMFIGKKLSVKPTPKHSP